MKSLLFVLYALFCCFRRKLERERREWKLIELISTSFPLLVLLRSAFVSLAFANIIAAAAAE
jgi:hypothetical protein